MEPTPSAELDSDNVIRFPDTEHFLRELAGNLGKGRALVRSRRSWAVGTHLRLEIEAPGVSTRVPVVAQVVFTRPDQMGFEFIDFDEVVLPALDLLGREAETGGRRGPGRAPASRRDTFLDAPFAHGSAEIHFSDDESRNTESPSIHTIAEFREPFGESDGLPGEAASKEDRSPEDRGSSAATGRIQRPSSLDTLGTPVDPTPLEPESLSDPDRGPILCALPRLTPAGFLRIEDPATLLGLYLALMRHGRLIVVGRPRESVGTMLELRIIAHRMVAMKARLLSQDGELATLALFDTEPVEELLEESFETWRDSVLAFGLGQEKTGEGPAFEPQRLSPNAAGKATEKPAKPSPAPLAPASSSAGRLHPEPSTPSGRADVGLPRPEARIPRPSSEDPSPPPPPATADSSRSLPSTPAPSPPSASPSLPPATAVSSNPASSTAALGAPASPEAPPSPSPPPTGPTPRSAPSPTPSSTLSSNASSTLSSNASSTPSSNASGTPSSRTAPSGPATTPPTPSATPTRPSATSVPEVGTSGSGGASVAPPEAPVLRGDTIHFTTREDLAGELERNLRNGGLFVAAAPLDLRSRHTLKLAVGGDVLPFEVPADVVFAAGDRVGFSVLDTPGTVSRVRAFLASPSVPSGERPGTIDIEPAGIRAQDAIIEDVRSFSGRIVPPPAPRGLLEFQVRRLAPDDDPPKETSGLALVELVVTSGWKGVLRIDSGPKTLSAWFHAGSVAFVENEPYEEATGLGRLLVNAKKLSEVGLREALDVARTKGVPLGRVLVSLGRIKKSELSTFLREQTRLKTESALEWRDGGFDFAPWRDPPGSADLVLTKGLVILARYVRQRYLELDSTEIETLLGRNIARPVKPVDDFDDLAGALLLLPKEIRFLEVQLDGKRSISDAALGSPIGRLASLRMVAMGLTLGFIRFQDGSVGPLISENTSVARESSLIRRITQLALERLERFNGQNHFEVLGVHWSAHQRSYREAYARARSEFKLNAEPWSNAPAHIVALVKRIHARLDEAYAVLSNTDKRIAYRKDLFEKSEREFAADMLIKKGELALMRGDRVGAIECLETAVELVPSPRSQALLETARSSATR